MHKEPGRNRQASGATSLAWALLLSALIHAALVLLVVPTATLMPVVTESYFIFQAHMDPAGGEITPKHLEQALPLPEKRTPPSGAPEIPSGLITPAFSIPNLYYEASELDTIPASKQTIEPHYPATALAGRISGEVRLEMLVDEQGTIQSLRVLESSPPGFFDQAAIDAFQDKKFEPGLRNGRPVKSRLKIMVYFDAP